MDEKFLEMASENEERQRQQAIHDHQHREREEQSVIDGVVVCILCQTPIPKQRLKMLPDAVRCVGCQEFIEKQQRMFV